MPLPRDSPRYNRYVGKLRKHLPAYGSITFVALFLIATIAVSGILSGIHRPSVVLASEMELSGRVTFYSAPDNNPPGSRKISFPGSSPRHARAGGTGTYEDPQTFASAYPKIYPAGTKIYVPRMQRYYVMEDLCDCSHGEYHVDLWLEPSGTDSQILSCEKALTAANRKETIIKDPDPNQPVNLTPLISDGVCRIP